MTKSDICRTTALPDHYDRIPTVSRGRLSTATAEKCNIDSSTDVLAEHITLKGLLVPAVVEQNSYVNTGLVMTESPAYNSLRNLQADGSKTSDYTGTALSPENSTLPSSEAAVAFRESQTELGFLDHGIYLHIKSSCTPEEAIDLPNTVADQSESPVTVQRDSGEFLDQPPLKIDDDKQLVEDRRGENGEENNFDMLLPPAEFIDSSGLQPGDVRHEHEANMEATNSE
jgi:hypothetical protein